MTARISRRRLLGAALGGGAVALAACSRPWRGLVRFVEPDVAARLAGAFHNRGSASVVGRRYLDARGGPPSVTRLADDVAAAVRGGRPAIVDADDDGLHELLADAVRSDFRSDRVVDVDGWILSATEARLYALTALV
jgi:hypothetical protein